jgi:hypothetical protein
MGNIVICMPVGNGIIPTDGSLTRRCHACRRDIYVGPETLMQAGGDCVLACLECGMRMAANDEDPAELLAPSPLVKKKILEAASARGMKVNEEDIDRTVAGIARMLNARPKGSPGPELRPPPS